MGFAQKNPNIVYASDNSKIKLDLPSTRNVYGGTIINVKYKGTRISYTQKGAFEYACKLVEENIPTTFPINITVEFENLQDDDCLALVETYSVPFDTPISNKRIDKVYLKRYAQIYDYMPNFNKDEDGLKFFRDSPDAKIKFSSRVKYDYNIDQSKIDPDKYDFITVAIKALLKVVGFSLKAYSSGNTLIALTPSNQYTSTILSDDVHANYNLAISDSAYIIPRIHSYNKWLLVSKPPYRQGISLNYFVDSPDKETAIMQYGLSKGSYIRYIGNSIQDFFSFCDWDRPIATGFEGLYVYNANKQNVIPFQGNTKDNQSHEIFLSNTTISSPQNKESYSSYIYSIREIEENGSYVLLQDGSWQSFNYLEDLNNNDKYARTVDGYLRLKIISTSYGPGNNYKNWNVEYKLYDYLPQNPTGGINRILKPQSDSKRNNHRGYSNTDEDEFVDVEIGIKNLEGTTSVLVEQTDSDYPEPFSYVIENISEGKFMANMNRRYPSTFKLTYINKNGRTIGQPFTIDLKKIINIEDQINISTIINNDGIIYIIDGDESVNLNYFITNLHKGNIVDNGIISNSEGIINTSSLKEGFYNLSIFNGNNRVSELKWKK